MAAENPTLATKEKKYPTEQNKTHLQNKKNQRISQKSEVRILVTLSQGKHFIEQSSPSAAAPKGSSSTQQNTDSINI